MNIFGVEHVSDLAINGTSLKGYVETTYDELVEKFGEPTITDGDKTTVEWNLVFECDADNGSLGEDGNTEYVTATIYDWKTSNTPMSEYDWHIGGFSEEAIEAVESALGKYAWEAEK